jgi:hypothetical protein
MYFPTCLALLGEIHALPPPAAVATVANGKGKGSDHHEVMAEFALASVTKRRLTYCRWGNSPKSPETLDAAGEVAAVFDAAVKEGCLFARKFRPGSVGLEAWLTHMRKVEA